MQPADQRRIEQLLERAGRHVQRPRHPGWASLRDRLEAIRQDARPGWLGVLAERRWAIPMGAAAMIAAAVGISLWLAWGPTAVAQDQPIQVIREDIELTVFGEFESPRPTLYMPVAAPVRYRDRGDWGSQARVQPAAQVMLNVQMEDYGYRGPTVRMGMALIKDRRLVLNLKKGDNEVRFTDVAATIDPTSVRLVSNTDPLGTKVVEQNFEFDLASADALLKRYVDRRITCIDKEGGETQGFLAAYDPASIVLTDRPTTSPSGKKDRGNPPARTQTLVRGDLKAIRLAGVPKDLHTRPTLVWKLRTERAGRHDTTLSYLCGHVKWRADYVIVVEPGGGGEKKDLLDWKGWVTLENRSGSGYEQAGIKLIAGDVNRVPDPWAPAPPGAREWLSVDEDAVQLGVTRGGTALAEKRFVEKAFFEYHLYTLSAPSTVRDNQIKQLNLLKAEQVKAKRRFVFEPNKHARRAAIVLELKNEEDNHLGMPLPKGRVTFMQRDADGELQFVGRDEIDHTSKDEELELELGHAFEVVGERKVLKTQRPWVWSGRREVQDIQILLRNHKDEAIQARCVEHLHAGRNWDILQPSDPWTKEDVTTVHFDFVLGPNEEKQITYTVDYRW